MRKQKVIQVCGGYDYALILCQSGSLFSTGKNQHEELHMDDSYCFEDDHESPIYDSQSSSCSSCSSFDHDCENDDISTVCLIDPKWFNHEKITQICSGNYYSMALTQEGNVYTWEQRYYGTLGLGTETNHTVPQKIGSHCFNNERVRLISAGSYYAFAVTEKNKVYSWGENFCGELAIGEIGQELTPQLINPNSYNNEKVMKVCCGGSHVLLLTEPGNVYLCGENKSGDLGLGHNNNTYSFERIDLNRFGGEKVKDIEAGIFSLALTQNGALYSWGYNGYGQLGLNDTTRRNKPHLIDPSDFKGEKITKIGCVMCHSFAITHSGKVYSWGDNQYGQLGLGHCNQVLLPTEINQQYFKGETIVSLSGSWNKGGNGRSFGIAKSGKLFTWGDNDNDQLGLGHCRDMNTPQLCCPELFGEEITNEKLYKNVFFEDVLFEFD